MIPKRHYYYNSLSGSRKFELALSRATLPLGFSLIAVSSKDAVATIKGLIAKYGEPGWLPEWLKLNKVPAEAIAMVEERLGLTKQAAG